MSNTNKTITASSYRTYEEWKRGSDVAAVLGVSRVLTVPMRNGNFTTEPDISDQTIVLTVPMRNGNYI